MSAARQTANAAVAVAEAASAASGTATAAATAASPTVVSTPGPAIKSGIHSTATSAASTSATTTASTPSFTASHAIDKSDSSIRTFLLSIHPSMDTLVPLFTEAGVISSASLGSVAAMPHAEQTAFLREDVKLSPLQARLVRLALVELMR
jgi:hypothetical protein